MTDSPPGDMVVSSTTNPASVSPDAEDDQEVHVPSPAVYHHHLRHAMDEHFRHRNQLSAHHIHHLRHHQSLQSNDVDDIDSTTNDQLHFVTASVSPPSEPIAPNMMVDVSANQVPPQSSSAPPVAVEEVIPYSESQNHHLVQFYDHNLNHQSVEHPSPSPDHHHQIHQESSASLHMYMDHNSSDYSTNGAHASYLPSMAHQQPHQVIRMYHPIVPEGHHQMPELPSVSQQHTWSQSNFGQSLPSDMSLQEDYQSQMLPPSESSRAPSRNGMVDGEREEDLSLDQRSHHHQHQLMNSNESVAHHQMMMCENSMNRLHHQPQSQIHHLLHSEHLQGQDEIIISDVPVESRARASLPTSYLYIEPIDDLLDFPEVVYGVFSRKVIPQKTQFGPVEGVIMPFNGSRNIHQPNLTVFISDSMILDQSDENKSNWMRFVRTANSFEEQNLVLVTKEQSHPNPDNSRELITTTKFFFITTKPIGPRQELKVWYSKEYADRFRLKFLEDEIADGQSTPSEIPIHHHQMNQNHFSDPNAIGSNRICDQDPLSLSVSIDNHLIHEHNSHVNQNVDSGCFQQHQERQETSYTSLMPIPPEVPLPIASNSEPVHPTDLMPAAGHKLRNKIAKSQQQQLQLQKTQQSNQNNISESLKSFSNVQSASSISSRSTIAVRQEKSKEYKCDTCGKTFPRFYSLRRHMIMHSGEKKFKCPICHMSFSHVYNRNRHVKRHSANYPTSDKKDDTSPPTEPSPPSGPAVLKPQSSLVSNVSLPPKLKITKIIISDSNPKPKPPLPPSIKLIEIPQPVTSSTSIDSTRTSERQQSGGSSPSSNAPESTTPNIVRSMISKAKKMRAGMLGNRFKCNKCYKCFGTDERLQKHYLVHSSDDNIKPLSCSICSKRFFNNSALSCHLKIHRDQPRKYECVLCKTTFDCNSTRKEHVTSHLDSGGQFSCPTCKKKFHEFSSIRKHIRAFHSGKQFPCHVCEKVFPRPDKLKLHMLRHSDKRDFLCQSCGKQFKRKDKLKEHIQRMHSADRDARLAQRAAAKAAAVVSDHSEWNNGGLQVAENKKFVPKVSPNDYHRFIYKCHSCLLGFKRRGMLVNHLAKRHPETSLTAIPELNLPILKTTRDYYCQYCDKVYKSSSKRKSHILKNHPGLSLPISSRARGSLGIPTDVPNPTYSATVGSVTTHPHPCSWCHKQYASKAKLLQHQRKKHPGKVESPAIRSRRNVDQSEIMTSNVDNQQHLDHPKQNPSVPGPTIASISVADYRDNEQMAVSVPTSQTQMMNSTLIAILGNLVNNGTASSNALANTTDNVTDHFQELLQSNPTVANDLLTQAMSELTNTHHNHLSKENQQSMMPGGSMNWP